MSNDYKINHYVPQWYQKRFLPKKQKNRELFYLKLKPNIYKDSKGNNHKVTSLRRLGFKHCFAEENLYATKLSFIKPTVIEEHFFGNIDRNGRNAVEYFYNFSHPSVNSKAFRNMVLYMSTQKLRTPKGLDWLSRTIKKFDKEETLKHMVALKSLYSAIWTECIWQIADASKSKTKFIISDHPITVYNYECNPSNKEWCQDSNDPDIRLHGTHTIFPLGLDKVLILTNSSWVKNPYQSPVEYRPNPNPFRGAIFNFLQIQTLRYLSEEEVQKINFVIKNRAYEYIAAADEEWLFPENDISISDWKEMGKEYLFMPDPRPVNYGGDIMIGWKDGSTTSYDQYGRRPWDPDYGKESNSELKENMLYKFKGEFAHKFGPQRRGRSFEMAQLDPVKDNKKMHDYHLSLYKKSKQSSKNKNRDNSSED